MTYTRKPRGSMSRVTLGLAQDLGIWPGVDIDLPEAKARRWAVRCDSHFESKEGWTRKSVESLKSQDFCTICAGHWDDYEIGGSDVVDDKVEVPFPSLAARLSFRGPVWPYGPNIHSNPSI